MRYFYICFLSVLLFSTGCATNYRLVVIREAREYALEQHPDLSDESIHWIKFTTPKLQDTLLYSRGGSAESKHDITQTCVTWDLPDCDGKSLMVVGFGERELYNWSPNRTIFKRFRFVDDLGKKQTKTRKRKRTSQ